MHNLLSFLLGLAAWGFGLAAALKPAGRWLSHASFLACGISLVLQLAEVRRRVGLQDWAALLDTMDAVLPAAGILLAVTAGLNLTAWLRGK